MVNMYVVETEEASLLKLILAELQAMRADNRANRAPVFNIPQIPQAELVAAVQNAMNNRWSEKR